jgi:two-component system sensor histidine kinase KdpD
MSLIFGRMPPWSPRRAIRATGIAIVALAASTVAVAALEQGARIPYAAPVYLLAVMTVGLLGGTAAAIPTALASFILYDFLFIRPQFTLTVADPNEWLDLLLFLAVAVVIGRLAARQAERTEEVAERAREAEALFRISRSLATSRSLVEAVQTVLAHLRESAAMDRVWLGLGPTPADERIAGDTAQGQPLPVPIWHVVLQRQAGDEPARWVRTHVAVGLGRRAAAGGAVVHRIRLEVPGETLGSLWALRSHADDPSRAETRILSAAADQLGQAVRRERLIEEALEAEISRRSDALKTALLDSVSHDLRTPLATIRAAAGSMLDPGISWTSEEHAEALRSIDAEAERMNRLVRNLLDLSRIEGGALHPDLGAHDLDEMVARVLKRIPRTKEIRVELPDDLLPALVDDMYLDEVLSNLLENAVRYGGPTICLSANQRPGDRMIEVVVEDDGPGVPDAEMGHLFEKFYRVRRPGEGSRHGMGIGLTVAQGLTRAMSGEIAAGRSLLGGLAVRVRVPAADLPPDRDDPTVERAGR